MELAAHFLQECAALQRRPAQEASRLPLEEPGWASKEESAEDLELRPVPAGEQG